VSQQGLRKHTPFKLSDDDSPKLQVQFPQVQFCSIFVRFLAKSVSSNAKKKNNSTIQHFLLVTERQLPNFERLQNRGNDYNPAHKQKSHAFSAAHLFYPNAQP